MKLYILLPLAARQQQTVRVCTCNDTACPLVHLILLFFFSFYGKCTRRLDMLINVIGTVELITRQEHEVLCICEVAVVNLSFLLYFHSCLLCGRALHETPCFGSREIVMRSHSCTRICLYFFSLSLSLPRSYLC